MSRSASASRWLFIAAASSMTALLVWSANRPRTAPQPAPQVEAEAAPPSRYPNPWPDPPPADVAALLDGLAPGAPLPAGFVVRGISPVHEQRIVIDVERGEAGFRVWVVQRGTDERRPPGSSEHYAVYFVQPRPTADAIDDDARREVLREVLRRIRKTEATTATPAGL